MPLSSFEVGRSKLDVGRSYFKIRHSTPTDHSLFSQKSELHISVEENGDENGVRLRRIDSSTDLVADLVHRFKQFGYDYDNDKG